MTIFIIPDGNILAEGVVSPSDDLMPSDARMSTNCFFWTGPLPCLSLHSIRILVVACSYLSAVAIPASILSTWLY